MKPFKRWWTLLLAGIGCVVVGFLYDVMFAGIPYQDPTPVMIQSYALHQRIASTISGFGGALVMLSLLYPAWNGLCKLALGRQDPP